MKVLAWLSASALLLAIGGDGSAKPPGASVEYPVGVRAMVAPELDDLIGCYTSREGFKPEVKVDKHDGRYFLSGYPNWGREVAASPPSNEDLERLFGDQLSFYITGLSAGHVGVFKVRPGMIVHGKPVSTGYALALFVGRSAAYRVPCP